MITALNLRNFDEDGSAPRPKPGEKLYTSDEVRAMLRAAHEKGREAGVAEGRAEAEAEAQTSQLAQQAETLEALGVELARLSGEAVEHRAALEAQVIDFALSVAEKVFPELIERLSTERAAQNVRRALKMAIGSTRMRIYLSPAALAALEPEIRQRAAYYKLEPALDLRGDATMQDGEVRMEWDRGSLEHAYERMCAQILEELRAVHARVSPALKGKS